MGKRRHCDLQRSSATVATVAVHMEDRMLMRMRMRCDIFDMLPLRCVRDDLPMRRVPDALHVRCLPSRRCVRSALPLMRVLEARHVRCAEYVACAR